MTSSGRAAPRDEVRGRGGIGCFLGRTSRGIDGGKRDGRPGQAPGSDPLGSQTGAGSPGLFNAQSSASESIGGPGGTSGSRGFAAAASRGGSGGFGGTGDRRLRGSSSARRAGSRRRREFAKGSGSGQGLDQKGAGSGPGALEGNGFGGLPDLEPAGDGARSPSTGAGATAGSPSLANSGTGDAFQGNSPGPAGTGPMPLGGALSSSSSGRR